MSTNLYSVREFVQDQFEQLLVDYQKSQSIVLSHCSELTHTVISDLESKVEEKAQILNIAKGPLKKIFFISVETLQNMFIHGHKNELGKQYNFFIISKTDTKVDIISANLVANEAVSNLEKQIHEINAFEDEKALKTYYLERLENNTISDKGGAGLGFITIAMKSGNKLKADFKHINDQVSLFTLITTVNLS